ncbi:GGDEF domain-containing protein [Enterovirga aerilata]|uniref:diguanylate cyclase n=1 Tax=Enterovirga aerilata TaxID=2730920 RepID=A0A849I0N6_9HYPH|nr:GGDEF domain-containing protein [Enterovirga sp. DB1703]NNM71134.1 GGDEF domain-containing protein [Enterovirga sp. DB1703]
MRQPARRAREPSEEIRRLRAEIRRLACELRKVEAEKEALAAASVEDPLTGLLNRRGFMRDLARAVSFVRRYKMPAGLLFVDLDRFKPINDTHGHEVGDRALKHVAACLKANLRASDVIGRLGGDEFAVLLWRVDEALARQKAEALEAVLAGTPLPEPDLTVEASIGAAAIRPEDEPEAALARADAAMYRRKRERKAARAAEILRR